MKELVIATTNKGKLREIKELLKELPLKIFSLADYPDAPEIVEDGKTFRANAFKKAMTLAVYTKKLTLGEDSGLEVKTLGNAPGIYSARFSGPTATDKKNNLKLLHSLRGIPFDQRQAQYRCRVALVEGIEIIGEAEGRCGGVITTRARGQNGFGYDPYFFLPRYNKTFGVLDPEIKSRISHRARAFKKIKITLQKYLQHLLK